MKTLIVVLALCLCGAAAAQNADNPGSLWPSDYHSPLVDRKAHTVGDLVAIVINESSSSSFSATSSTSRKESTAVGNINVPLIKHFFDSLGMSNTASYDGQGSSTQKGAFSAQLTAIVTKVLPNGNLVIEGTRWIRVNKDTQTVSLTGIIRPDDIRADNSVLSSSIAQAEIKSDGKGQISASQKKGVLARLLEWLF